ncbi:hypothetical protein GCM10009093_15140 [Brevundimonas terrae]|uniref:histidine kinase n=2 Tax=Brevundimonas terrae TaxID=363631 RepID=A0ABP3I432_9CAUL
MSLEGSMQAKAPAGTGDAVPVVEAVRFEHLETLAAMLLQAEAFVLELAGEPVGELGGLVQRAEKMPPGVVLKGEVGLWAATPVACDGQTVGILVLQSPETRPEPDEGQCAIILQLAKVAGDLVAGMQAQRASAEQARMLDMVEDMSGVGWWHMDLQKGSARCSRRVGEIHGLPSGQGDYSLRAGVHHYHPSDRAELEAALDAAMVTGEGYNLRLRLNHPDGQQRTVMSHSQGMRDAAGTLHGLFGVFRDVTEQEAVVAKLRRNEARYRLLAENVSDVITRVKMDGSSKYISPAIQSMLGWTLEEMSGQSTDYVYREDRHKVLKAIQQAVKTGKPTRLEHRAVHRDGRILWVECTFKAIRDDNGEVDDVVVVIRDDTQRKLLEGEVIEAKERAEKAAEAKTEFLANMSHELRTPLTSVIGYSGLLKNSPGLTPTQRLYGDRIAASSEALLMVINDILDYSKLEADAVELENAPFDLRQRITDTAGIIESQCAAKGLGLKVDLDKRLPEILSGDASRLRQVLLNFLSNAVKFTASGSVGVKVFGAETADGRYRLRVEVSDTGIGLSQEKGELIFGRFTQADASTTRVYGGTGLGLAISRRLIELMDGQIGYESEAGEGATFWFEVPLDFDFALPVSVAVDTVPDMGVQGRILMVDDAEANRELVKIILGTLGLEVETACNGVEAVAAVRRRDFDLVLMDVHMPQMDGLAATREIRQQVREKHLPILALTANVGGDQVQKCLDAGMDGHLPKPIQVADLAQTLKKWLQAE